MLDVPPSSRASFAPTVWIGASLRFLCQQKNPPWEQSLLAIAVGQSALMLDVPPSTRASFAPTVWIGASLRFPCQQKSPVGAKLARDSSVSVCLDVGCPPSSQASFGPTVWIGASLRFPCQQKSPVGAKLARDSGVSVCLDVDAAVIASKLCSHSLIGASLRFPCQQKSQWEQSLLAIAVCQSALMLDVRRHREQALLHGLDRCQPAISLPTKIPCGSKACSR